MLAVPRAAHAVAAALVQVTNAASSPVIAQGIGQQATQIVQIECNNWAESNGCFAVLATGIPPFPLPSSYVVPEGQTLGVNAVDILSGAAAGSPATRALRSL